VDNAAWNFALNSREWAVLTLFAGIAALIIIQSFRHVKLRESIYQLLKIVRSRSIFIPLILLVVWVVLATAGAYRVGLWTPQLAKDTVVWFVASAFATIFAALKASKDDHFFRTSVRGAIGITALLQFVMNLHTFSFVAELCLQLLLLLTLTLHAFASTDAKYGPTKRFLDWLIAGLGLWVTIATAYGLWSHWGEIATSETAVALVYSFWLPLAVLVFIWALALYMSYEILMQRLSNPVFGHRAPWRARFLVLVTVGARLRVVYDLAHSPTDLRNLAQSRKLSETRESVRVYLRRRDRKRNEPLLQEQRLARFAGVAGRGTDGKHLDQRELSETRAALTWIANCHMGHYRNLGRYRADLLNVLGDLKGLGPDHGVEDWVSLSGDAWYAWRRVPCGIVLGIGAGAPPPDQWLYADDVAPTGPPGVAAGWEQWQSSEPDWRG
jgi:hypothetical protein